MDKLVEEKLVDALSRAIAAEKIADRAMGMAQEALQKIEELKARQVPAYYTPPDYSGDYSEPSMAGQMNPPITREVAKPVKLSPFSLGGMPRLAEDLEKEMSDES